MEDDEDSSSSKNKGTRTTSFLGVEPEPCLDQGEDLTQLMTKFLSLDKCLPRRQYLQVLNMAPPLMSGDEKDDKNLRYDLHWLAILKKTHHWTQATWNNIEDPNISKVHITKKDIDDIKSTLAAEQEKVKGQHDNDRSTIVNDPTIIPSNFCMTVQPHGSLGSDVRVNGGKMVGNPQTDRILSILDLDHKVTMPFIYQRQSNGTTTSADDCNEIDLGSDLEEKSFDEAVTSSKKDHLQSVDDMFDLLKENVASVKGTTVIVPPPNPSTTTSITRSPVDDNEIELE